jgi:hypothetical protein
MTFAALPVADRGHGKRLRNATLGFAIVALPGNECGVQESAFEACATNLSLLRTQVSIGRAVEPDL